MRREPNAEKPNAEQSEVAAAPYGVSLLGKCTRRCEMTPVPTRLDVLCVPFVARALTDPSTPSRMSMSQRCAEKYHI